MTRFASVGLVAATALSLGLTACKDRESARIDAPEPEPLAYLAAASELPYAEPAQVNWRPPERGYQWAERAYGLQQAVYDTPPDYGFEYSGTEPLVWETEDDWALYAEPWDDGYRYYYYEPGAAYPYFVRDRDYGYGFDPTGVLIAVFDVRGRYLPQEFVYRVAPVAGRYYVRGRDLRNASARAGRIRVDERVWANAAPRVNRSAQPWLRAARDDRTWREWRQRDGDRELRRFSVEQQRRHGERRVAAVDVANRPSAPPLVREAHRVAEDLGRAQAQGQRRGPDHRERGQAQAERSRVLAEARAERGRQAQAERRQDEVRARSAERGRQAQVERGHQQQAERRMAQTQAERGQRQPQGMQHERQAQARRQPHARAAEKHAQQAAGRERGGGPQRQAQQERGPGGGHGHGRKD